MTSDKQSGGAWKVKQLRVRHTYQRSVGAERFIHEQSFFVAKQRWAARALAEIQGRPGLNGRPTTYLWCDIPGTNLTLFVPDPQAGGILEFSRKFLQEVDGQLKELHAILDVPMEEADGVYVAEDRKADAGRKGGA